MDEMKDRNVRKIKWGEIYYCDLGAGKGSVQSKLRPVLIIQNNIGNENGPTSVVAAISSVMKKCICLHTSSWSLIAGCVRSPLSCWNKSGRSIQRT